MTEFEFDKASVNRIEKIVQQYPISLKDCADILELAAPLYTMLTSDGFYKVLHIIEELYCS